MTRLGARERAVEEEIAAPGSVDDTADGRSARGPGRWARGRGRTVVVALCAVALLTSGVLLFSTAQLAGDPAVENRALTDTDATDRVGEEVATALTRAFSYTPKDTRATADAAREVFDGRAEQQYEALFAKVERKVAEQKLTLTTTVVRTGVVRLTEREARLLVFLDQVTEREGDKPGKAAAQLAVTAEPRGEHWRITDLKSR
ncbi:hypothetical protein [Streptomyces daliensis]|uniref:Mce-associated membrane protein n=1 Tax=Streptomyces daliensis TaxID=299421 RepID=A0A8T4IRH2_9ACTN|nr:hypothetical protein [Streptomyces daliensis]